MGDDIAQKQLCGQYWSYFLFFICVVLLIRDGDLLPVSEFIIFTMLFNTV